MCRGRTCPARCDHPAVPDDPAPDPHPGPRQTERGDLSRIVAGGLEAAVQASWRRDGASIPCNTARPESCLSASEAWAARAARLERRIAHPVLPRLLPARPLRRAPHDAGPNFPEAVELASNAARIGDAVPRAIHGHDRRPENGVRPLFRVIRDLRGGALSGKLGTVPHFRRCPGSQHARAGNGGLSPIPAAPPIRPLG